MSYYYSCSSSISDSGLSFRRLRTEHDNPNCAEDRADDFRVQDESGEEQNLWDYPSDEDGDGPFPSELPRNIELGTVPATSISAEVAKGTGRMLSFPNWLQHCVEGLKNTAAQGDEPAVRKIVRHSTACPHLSLMT